MRTLKLELAGMIAAGVLGVGMSQSAFAQTAPADPVETCDPDTPCPQPIAQAQPQAAEPAPAPPAPMTYPTETYSPEPYVEADTESWIKSVGLGFSAGGGVDDFASDTMRSTTGVGGGWNVRATLGTKTFLALEGSYIGSAQNINALGLDNDALLVGNGIQAAGRLNFVTDFPVQPFVYAGVAWRHYDITDSNINTSDIANDDDVAEFPGGVGVSGYLYGMMADVRGEYRFATGEDLAPSQNDSGDATMDRWAVTGSLGFSY